MAETKEPKQLQPADEGKWFETIHMNSGAKGKISEKNYNKAVAHATQTGIKLEFKLGKEIDKPAGK